MPGDVEVRVVAPNGEVLAVLIGWVVVVAVAVAVVVVLFACTDASGTDLVVMFLGALADVTFVVVVDT